MPRRQMTYADAGVDVGRLRDTQKILAKRLQTTFQTRRGQLGEPIIPIGHYAGLIDLGGDRVLSLHVDSVGTKVMIAQMMKKYDTIGIDCVAMCANDLICTGSDPVAFLDYIALSRPDPSIVDQIAVGIAEGAKEAGMAVVGGETAIVPDLLSSADGGGLDLIGMAAGIGSRKELILGKDVQDDDVLVGVASSGIHSNGLTLARKVLLNKHTLRDVLPGLERSLGEELLEPTRIYVKPVREASRKMEIHGLAHVTGGGLTKLGRIVAQAKFGAALEDLPPAPDIFQLVKREGNVSDSEMYRTFNMGVGFVVICPEEEVDGVIRLFKRHHQEAFRLGRIVRKTGVWIRGARIQ